MSESSVSVTMPASEPSNAPAPVDEAALCIRGLCVDFKTDQGTLRALDGVDLTLPKGKTLGVVGESGSGKSVTALSVMRLLPKSIATVSAETLRWRDQNLLSLSDASMRSLRGNRISMVFQEPMTSLNPVFTVGDQIGEVLRLHQQMNRSDARREAIRMLSLCGIPAPEDRVDVYPHQLSGGMRQRVMIAMALACQPDVLIADEPTTALDVTIQAQILDLLKNLQQEFGMSILLITHDLGVVAQVCDEVQVMYAGTVVERGSVEDIFERPQHPYTLGLLRSIPGSLPASELPKGPDGRPRLLTIDGVVPDLRSLKPGCRFRDRCDRAEADCQQDPIPLTPRDDHSAHVARCLHPHNRPGAIVEDAS